MWQFDILYSGNTQMRSPQDYLNMAAVEESKKLNGRRKVQRRIAHILRRMISHAKA